MSDVEWLSLRPSSVQMAPELLQLVVSGSVMVTAPLSSGSTVTVQYWLLPWVFRSAFRMSAPVSSERVVTDSCVAGADVLAEAQIEGELAAVVLGGHVVPKLAVTGTVDTSGGPATVADGLLLSCTGFSSLVQMAPVVPQSRLPGSVTVVASLPHGVTVISQLSFCPLLRRARVTSPFVTVNEWSRSVA